MHHPEPRFSRIAAVIADPSRAHMLAALLGGEYRSAGELATAAGITPQAASTQLARLVDNALVIVRQQGRHRYFALADDDVAHALEALALVAERDDVSARWSRPAYQPLKCARRCYGHMAGELGVAQFVMLRRCHYLAAGDQGLQLTPAGREWVAQLGVVLPNKPVGRWAYPCMDWSERRDHLAGALPKALLAHYVSQRWLTTQAGSRALRLTARGRQMLLPLLQLPAA
ncbi:MAG: bacterial regulatory, arsR family protein [Polaromonas sp.]|nr:bacterial regulatory, arsR family protein [Polaromonas sp.]